MTMTFKYDEESSSSFKFCLTDTSFIYKDLPLYRIINGQEVLIDIVAKIMCFNSDKNNEIVLKSVGPTRLHYYGELIDYTLTKN
jgi:hypothetical protein